MTALRAELVVLLELREAPVNYGREIETNTQFIGRIPIIESWPKLTLYSKEKP